jgi:hypothetical protein
MAKKPDLSNIFAKTEGKGQADLSDLDEGNIRPTGVGLREGEISALDDIGRELGGLMDAEPIARNALMRIATRRFIAAVRAGDITLEELAEYFDRPEKPQPKLRL